MSAVAALATCGCKGPALRSYAHGAHERNAEHGYIVPSWPWSRLLTEKQAHVAAVASHEVRVFYRVAGDSGGPSRRSTLRVELAKWSPTCDGTLAHALALTHDRWRERQKRVAERLGGAWACGAHCAAAFAEKEEAP